MTTLVAGAGGFVGNALVAELLSAGHRVRAADIKPFQAWQRVHAGADNRVLDLRDLDDCRVAVEGVDSVFNLACDMGGIGFIEAHKADCMLSVLINTHLLLAARDARVQRYFFASSACVYSVDKQSRPDLAPLRESDAYPAQPEDGYGWEKLFSERMCRHFREDFGIATRVARYHNIYGPYGAYDGGREKAPAAICRKLIQAKLSRNYVIEVWGDGKQTRSFTYIDDCIHGTLAVMTSDVEAPINLGSSKRVSIDELIDLAEAIAGIEVRRIYNRDAPGGVRGRSSDNALIEKVLGWQPRIRLEDGLEKTYRWIYDEMVQKP
ncbi:MAG: NAD-dependent epimerase/dehydratase family protein [Pseudomonadota bacterium]|nr:NAD-dependent epimerase/dehydratase family protein [Pseudomonadota bacterium]